MSHLLAFFPDISDYAIALLRLLSSSSPRVLRSDSPLRTLSDPNSSICSLSTGPSTRSVSTELVLPTLLVVPMPDRSTNS